MVLQQPFRTSEEIVEHFRSREVSQESWSYLKAHATRYAFLLEKITSIEEVLRESRSVTILDVGPSFFTELLRLAFPKDSLMTLGYELPESRGGHFHSSVQAKGSRQFHFDLNDAQSSEEWISTPPADLVIMAEVIEHLHTAPTLVLRFIHTLVADGGVLILETPNAASLKIRLKLLVGEHPYEMIRENSSNPGHFREYTPLGLMAAARSAGFEIRSCELSNYSPSPECPARKGGDEWRGEPAEGLAKEG